MIKQNFIALADAIRDHNRIAGNGVSKALTPFTTDQINALANFCHSQNSAFKFDRWTDYIAGKCGPNGGAR